MFIGLVFLSDVQFLSVCAIEYLPNDRSDMDPVNGMGHYRTYQRLGVNSWRLTDDDQPGRVVTSLPDGLHDIQLLILKRVLC